MEEWIGFLGSVLGGLIGGLFTYFGVRLTLKHEREKERKAELAKANEEKPRLEITNYLDFENTKMLQEENSDCDALVLKIQEYREDEKGKAIFIYDKKALDDKNLRFVEYEFKNIGMTEIEDICISTNLPKDTALLDMGEKTVYITNGILNYGVWSRKEFIKPGDLFKLRVYYIEKQIVVSNIGSPLLTVWLRDTNGRYWSQLLSSPIEDIDMPRLRDYASFKESIDVRSAIDCFRNPLLW